MKIIQTTTGSVVIVIHHGTCYKKNLNIRMYAHVMPRKPAQHSDNHMLVMVNFFDSIQCIVMFPSDVIEVFLCEVMPSNI